MLFSFDSQCIQSLPSFYMPAGETIQIRGTDVVALCTTGTINPDYDDTY